MLPDEIDYDANCEPEPAQDAPIENDDAIIKRLSSLNPLEYDRAWKEAAEGLGVRPATLDKLIIYSARSCLRNLWSSHFIREQGA
jgi:putative DNA primase/helicase